MGMGFLAGVGWLLALAAAMPSAGAATLAAAAPVAVRDDRGVEQRWSAPPQRIVSLLPSLTETVCALGGCERLVGVDRYSNWPASVQALPRLGGLDDLPLEALMALRPDVVLAARSARALERLAALGIPVLALDTDTLAQQRANTLRLAQLLGDTPRGPALLQAQQREVAAAAAQVPPGWQGARVYVEVSSTPHAAGDASFIGELLRQLGLRNIVPAALGPFPQLNPEFVVQARPDVMVVAAARAGALRERPGWASLPALQRGAVCPLDATRNDLLMRPGPRLPEAAQALAVCLRSLPHPIRPAAPAAP